MILSSVLNLFWVEAKQIRAEIDSACVYMSEQKKSGSLRNFLQKLPLWAVFRKVTSCPPKWIELAICFCQSSLHFGSVRNLSGDLQKTYQNKTHL